MPRCRIYFFTYKREQLLPRGIESLLKQTFSDWVCEVHNDCPEDLFPGKYIANLNDQRFILKNHANNLGPTASFNLAFEGCEEDYASLLEDDNWWEPTFLDEMIRVMDKDPNLDIAWSNMRIWKEHPGNIWEDTHNTIWPEKSDQKILWPQTQQAMGALHSNGAMIYRGNKAHNYKIPANSLFNAVELIRERCFKHPIYINSKVLANFSQTLFTNQSKEHWKWTCIQIMVLSSFILATSNKVEVYKECLQYYRKNNSASIISFILANMIYVKRTSLYKHFKIKEWIIFSKWGLKNLMNIKKIRFYLKEQNNVYQFLLKKTKDLSNNA
jgi:glycosyltransferase involved in cell wall biosynthesis